MAARNIRAEALRAFLGVVAGALVGTGAVFALIETMNPFADWFITTGNPFEMCGFAVPPVPSEAPCLAYHFGELGLKIFLCLAFVGLAIWWGLRSMGRASLLSLVLAWTVAGVLIETAYIVSDILNEPSLPGKTPLVLPLVIWGVLSRLVLLAGLLAAAMATVFWIIVGHRRAGED